MDELNMGIIREMPIPLASMELQQEFAARLKFVEELVAKQRRSRAELETLFVSLQHRALRGEL